jgi:hypothetical protein
VGVKVGAGVEVSVGGEVGVQAKVSVAAAVGGGGVGVRRVEVWQASRRTKARGKSRRLMYMGGMLPKIYESACIIQRIYGGAHAYKENLFHRSGRYG